MAQQVGINEQGDTIIVMDDGGWEKYTKERYEELVLQRSSSKEAKSAEEEEAEPELIWPEDAIDEDVSRMLEEEAQLADVPQEEVGQGKNKKKKKSGNKSPKTKKQKPGKNTRMLTKRELQLREEAMARADLAATESTLKLQEFEDASFELFLLEEELKNAYTNPKTTDEQIVSMEQKIVDQRQEEKTSKEAYERSRKLADFYYKLVDLPEDKRQKLLKKEYEKRGKEESELMATAIEESSPGLVDELHIEKKEFDVKDLKAQKKRQEKRDLISYPPKPKCPEMTVGYNEFTGKRKVSMPEAFLFSKTPKKMRLLLKDREYLEGYAGLAKVSNLTFLNLRIVISSTSAQKDYGLIEKGSRLTIKFIDGTSQVLFANNTVQGEVNSLEKTVTYEVSYYLDKSALKTLRKAEIDKLRLVWLTGFEDYDIYEVDFLANRIDCLQK
ncbi:MAG: hypothetical protein HKN16_06020 [Saprospiraceae bacterium]|nr:hypothetical protein [Saprospiraceae bacterium]